MRHNWPRWIEEYSKKSFSQTSKTAPPGYEAWAPLVTMKSTHPVTHSPLLHTSHDGSAPRDNFNKKSSGALSGSSPDVPYRSIHTLFQISARAASISDRTWICMPLPAQMSPGSPQKLLFHLSPVVLHLQELVHEWPTALATEPAWHCRESFAGSNVLLGRTARISIPRDTPRVTIKWQLHWICRLRIWKICGRGTGRGEMYLEFWRGKAKERDTGKT